MKNLLMVLFVSVFVISCKEEPVEYTSISGQWRCEENSLNNSNAYIIDIEKSTSNNEMYAIYNFNNEGQEEKIFPILRNDTLIIEFQFIGSSTISVEGFGYISADKKTMQLQYQVTKNNGITEVLCNCTHQ